MLTNSSNLTVNMISFVLSLAALVYNLILIKNRILTVLSMYILASSMLLYKCFYNNDDKSDFYSQEWNNSYSDK